MDRGYRKGQDGWNIISETGLRRKLVEVAANSRVRDGEACRCLYLMDIPACAWYMMPLWIKLKTEPPIMSSRLDLAQAREDWRCNDRLSTHMYKNM